MLERVNTLHKKTIGIENEFKTDYRYFKVFQNNIFYSNKINFIFFLENKKKKLNSIEII